MIAEVVVEGIVVVSAVGVEPPEEGEWDEELQEVVEVEE